MRSTLAKITLRFNIDGDQNFDFVFVRLRNFEQSSLEDNKVQSNQRKTRTQKKKEESKIVEEGKTS